MSSLFLTLVIALVIQGFGQSQSNPKQEGVKEEKRELFSNTTNNWIRVTPDLIFGYNVTNTAGDIKFQIRTKYKGWIGVGFGKVLTLVDFHIMYQKSDNEMGLYDAYSQTGTFSKWDPKPDMTFGGASDLTDAKLTIDEDGWREYTYWRNYHTDDYYDFQLSPDQNLYVVFLWNPQNEQLQWYDYQAVYELKFSFQSAKSENVSRRTNVWYIIHSVFILVVWGVIAQILITLVRHFKKSDNRFMAGSFWTFHEMSLWTAAAVTIICPIAIKVAAIPTYTPPSYKVAGWLHNLIGLIGIWTPLFLMPTGLWIRAFTRDITDVKRIYWMRILHNWGGHLVNVIVWIQMFIGAKLWEVETTLFTNVLIILLIWWIFSYSFLELYFKGSKVPIVFKMIKTTRNQIVQSAQDVNNYSLETFMEMLEDQKQNGKYLFTLDNLIIDATNYANAIAHPGGRQILKNSIGRDVGQFLNGSTGLICNPGELPFINQHSLEAFWEVKKFTIGKLDTVQYLLAHANHYKNQYLGEDSKLDNSLANSSQYAEKVKILFPFEVDETTVEQDWTLVGKAEVGKNVYKFSFANPNIYCVNEFKKLGGAKWLIDSGKDVKFTVTAEQLKRFVPSHPMQYFYNKECDRYYTVVRALNPINLHILDKNLQAYDKFRQTHSQPNFVTQLKGQSQNYTFIDIYAKVYENGLFSKYLDNLAPNDSLRMCGPNVTGLRLTRLFLESNPNIVCLSGGTAVTLFLDLIYYVYASCHTAFEQDEVPYKINLTLFAAFNNEEEAIGLQFLQSAAKNASDRFKLHLYFTKRDTMLESQNTQKFTSSFIKSAIKDVHAVDRWYFEGTSSFEADIQKALERLGVGNKILRT